MFRADVASITLFAEREPHAAERTRLCRDDAVGVTERITLDPREGVWARVAADGSAILLQRPIDDRVRPHFAERGVHKDAMVAPLFGDRGVIGTFVVGDRIGDASTFSGEDLKLFETLTNHASIALQNARLVDRLKESLAHLTETNRLKDDFVAAVSHELRTPLTSIQGYVKTLLRPGTTFTPEQQREFLEAVDRQGDRLRHLIEDLLVVSQLEAKELTPLISTIDVAQLIERVVAELRHRTAGRELDFDVPRGFPQVISDEGKIHQIVSNFVDNACKYSPPGSPVCIRARREGEGVTISVVDSGAGIPAGDQDKVFDRFYQVDQTSTREKGGTGLGLYICRHLAQAIGGRVWLGRSDTSGSEFSLWLPLELPHGAPGHADQVLPAARSFPASACG